MVLEEDCVASESVSVGWTVEDSVLETWSDPEVSLLSPKPELAEVANGITVLPVKSFASTNVSTGHAAIPHQMG